MTGVPQVAIVPSTLDLLGVELSVVGRPTAPSAARRPQAAHSASDRRRRAELRADRLPARRSTS